MIDRGRRARESRCMNMNESIKLSSLGDCLFDNRFAKLPEYYYARVNPTPVPAPRMVAFNPSAAALIDLDERASHSSEFIEVMAGNRVLSKMLPVASVYAGHQFGVYVPQLGDGRAILLGGVRNSHRRYWEIQLKGSGKTPYARFADGRAVLRSTIREYLASEALHALGIPTTRALSIVSSPLPVYREDVETAAVLCRLAPSHVRFGHFEYFFYNSKFECLQLLADHLIEEHHPEFLGRPDRYAAWLSEVVDRTARLMAQWQAFGFVHGVMNTDNFSILGLTVDYGPYGFMDAFDSRRVFNHSDEAGRYAWDQQPLIGHWNLSRLLQSTLPLLDKEPQAAVEKAKDILDRYPAIYSRVMLDLWGKKLGLLDASDVDRPLINRWLSILEEAHADFSLSFRALSRVSASSQTSLPPFEPKLHQITSLDHWLTDYRSRLRQQNEEDTARSARLNAVNPLYVLRNHLAERAIARALQQDYSEVDALRITLSNPFVIQPGKEHYAQAPPAHLAQPLLSCSS